MVNNEVCIGCTVRIGRIVLRPQITRFIILYRGGWGLSFQIAEVVFIYHF